MEPDASGRANISVEQEGDRATEKSSGGRGYNDSGWAKGSAGIVLDDEVRLHRYRIWHIGGLGCADKPAPHAVVVDLEIIWDVALAGHGRLKDERQLFRLRRQLDRVAV